MPEKTYNVNLAIGWCETAYNLAAFELVNGEFAALGSSAKKASELETTFSWPLNQLGSLAVQRGKMDEARSYYERATRVNMNDAEAQLNFAGFLEDQGQLAEARLHYQIFLRVVTPELAHMVPEVRERLSQLGQP